MDSTKSSKAYRNNEVDDDEAFGITLYTVFLGGATALEIMETTCS
jgi:hypothetical protein